MPSEPAYTDAQMIAAIRSSSGIISVAALKLGCSAQTVRNYMKRSPEIREAKNNAIEELLDLAEGKLIANIRSGKEASIFFFLKTQGKERGYIERAEHTGKNGAPLMPPATIDAKKLDTETLKAIRDAAIAQGADAE